MGFTGNQLTCIYIFLYYKLDFSFLREIYKFGEWYFDDKFSRREKVEIPATMSYITLKGVGADKTIIEWDDTADRKGTHGNVLGTYCSATFAVNAPYFVARNITFKVSSLLSWSSNDLDIIWKLWWTNILEIELMQQNSAPLPASGALGKQAVALRISADTASFIGCKFIGAQDTLYDHTGRHYFRDCYIEGSVDFIFGNGLSLYEGCHLHAVTNTFGALTAQKRDSLLQETGFSFLNCKVTGSGALYLGRAWGSFSTVVFAYTYMDKIITPRGWYNWGDKNREMYNFQCLLYYLLCIVTIYLLNVFIEFY